MTSGIETIKHGKVIDIRKNLYRLDLRFMFKGSFCTHFSRHDVAFYVKTQGKSGVNLHFYALRTHDVMGLGFSLAYRCLGSPRYCCMRYCVLMKCLTRLDGYESWLTPYSHILARSSGAAPCALLFYKGLVTGSRSTLNPSSLGERFNING